MGWNAKGCAPPNPSILHCRGNYGRVGGAIMEGWASLPGQAEEHLEGGLDALEADLAAIAAEDVAFR